MHCEEIRKNKTCYLFHKTNEQKKNLKNPAHKRVDLMGFIRKYGLDLYVWQKLRLFVSEFRLVPTSQHLSALFFFLLIR